MATSDRSAPLPQPLVDDVTAPPRAIGRRYVAPAFAGAVSAGVSMAVGELIAGVDLGRPLARHRDRRPSSSTSSRPARRTSSSACSARTTSSPSTSSSSLVALAIAAAVGIAASREIGRADMGVRRVRPRRPARRPPRAAHRRPSCRSSRPSSPSRPGPREPAPSLLGPPRRDLAVTAATAGDRRLDERPRRPRRPAAMPDWDRRGFLLAERRPWPAARSSPAGPAASSSTGAPLSQPSAGRDDPQAGASPSPRSRRPSRSTCRGSRRIVIPNDDFYRIDTALLPPHVDAASWSMKVSGMVDHAADPDLQRPHDDAPVRAVRDDPVRLERGRRRPRRQRASGPASTCATCSPRPASSGGDPDRRPVRGRLHGRLPDRARDGPGPRADDRRRR